MSAERRLATAALVLQGATLAAAPTALPDHAWTLRADLGLNTPADPLPGDGFLAVSLQRRLTRRLAIEAALGPGSPVTTLAKGSGGGTRKIDLGSGLHGALLAGVEHRLTTSGRTLVSLAGGPSLVSGDVFGTVPMARVELGFDWRFHAAGVFHLSCGYESALSTSRKPFDASDCLQSSGCPPYYRAGSGQVSTRWGLGLSF